MAASGRAKILNDVARYYRDKLEELATIAVREMGKPITQARAEVEFSADICDYYADNVANALDTSMYINGVARMLSSCLSVARSELEWSWGQSTFASSSTTS